MKPQRVLVLGGGPSGLSVARSLALSKKFPNGVVLLEERHRLGGWVDTLQRKSEKEESLVLFERGPHSLRPRTTGNGLRLVRLISELGLESRVLFPSDEARRRLLWTGLERGLVVLPNSLIGMLREPLTKRLIWEGILEVLFKGKVMAEDQSIQEFFSSHFSKETAGELVAGIVAGVYAGDASKLSMESCFPDILKSAREVGGSVVWSMISPKKKKNTAQTPVITPLTTATSITFRNGMHELVETLDVSARACGVEIHVGVQSPKLERVKTTNDDNEGWLVPGYGLFSHVVSTVPVPSLIRSLSLSSPGSFLSKDLATGLMNLDKVIDYVDVAVVNVAFRKESPKILGFGYLVPASNDQARFGCLGAIFDSVAFPGQQPRSLLESGGSVISVMMGGAHAPWIAKESEHALAERAVSCLRTQAGFSSSNPDDSLVSLHRQCIPQYRIGHTTISRAVRKHALESNLLLLGTGFLGVGLSDAVGGGLLETQRWLVHHVVG